MRKLFDNKEFRNTYYISYISVCIISFIVGLISLIFQAQGGQEDSIWFDIHMYSLIPVALGIFIILIFDKRGSR